MTVLVLASGAPDALAIPAPIQISGTGGQGVYIRPTPDTSQPARGWMPEGASPDYNCFAYGQVIGGVPIWFNVNYNGVTGYYASFYDNSSYRSDAELTAKYGVPKCGAAPTPPAPPAPEPPAPAPSGFPVYNADGGIYYRNSPRWADTSAVPGVGVYNGDRVRIICGAAGEAIGPYANTSWSYVENLSRSVGNGWVNEHFINDGASSNSWPSGVPMCGADVPGAAPPGVAAPPATPPSPAPTPTVTPPAPRPAAVYYSPFEAGKWEVGDGATLTAYRSQWYKSCRDIRAYEKSIALASGRPITTLAGWSLGRLGVLGYLKRATDAQLQALSYVILIDPGTYDELTCDRDMSGGTLLARWLTKNPNAHLVVISGADVSQQKNSKGIQESYFNAVRIWSQRPRPNLRPRVLTCNYKISHENAFRTTRYWIQNVIGTTVCPRLRDGDSTWKATATWHP